ncbi:hypothetical protein VFPPC_17790 [Pochonia chlamydosporia 170]|uniref:Uncharacterized protein n=1 Tax=Pochonia chlamydosporia 170 TaxID=1380566 RepID=A0A219AQF3_METCM|nr:hypothetical protein VFPPC_17790 [Pochonia chlamydosporia 170]OWT43017.1 hypothetical protein VFPPC_17790 [Pochonia chlamydosporia 170]
MISPSTPSPPDSTLSAMGLLWFCANLRTLIELALGAKLRFRSTMSFPRHTVALDTCGQSPDQCCTGSFTCPPNLSMSSSVSYGVSLMPSDIKSMIATGGTR